MLPEGEGLADDVPPPPLSVPTLCRLFHNIGGKSLQTAPSSWRLTTSTTPFLPLLECKAPLEGADTRHHHPSFLIPACWALPAPLHHGANSSGWTLDNLLQPIALHSVGLYNLLLQKEKKEWHKDTTLILHCYDEWAPTITLAYLLWRLKWHARTMHQPSLCTQTRSIYYPSGSIASTTLPLT